MFKMEILVMIRFLEHIHDNIIKILRSRSGFCSPVVDLPIIRGQVNQPKTSHIYQTQAQVPGVAREIFKK